MRLNLKNPLFVGILSFVLTASPALAATDIVVTSPKNGATYEAHLDPDTLFVDDNVDFTTDSSQNVDLIDVSGWVNDSSGNGAACYNGGLGTDHAGCTAYAPNDVLGSAQGEHSIDDATFGIWSATTAY